MNTTSKIIIATAVGITIGVTTAVITYKTVGISQTAYDKVVAYAAANGMSYRDAASKMVLGYRELPLFTGYIIPDNYDSLSALEQRDIITGELNNALVWIDAVNNPKI